MEILILDVLQIANYRKLGMCQFCIFCMVQISDILIFDVKTLFTWSGGPRFSGVGFFCFVSPRAWKQKKPTPLAWGPPLHVNRPYEWRQLNMLYGAQHRYIDFVQFLNFTSFKISDFLYFTFIMKTYTIFYSMSIIESLIFAWCKMWKFWYESFYILLNGPLKPLSMKKNLFKPWGRINIVG